MSEKFMTLSDEQKKIIKLTKGKHLVLAPPGTGKTELLSHRVVYALENGTNPDDILCLTFTNRAAKSMKERIESKISSQNIFIGNIHQFCSHFLYSNKIISRFTALLDEEDSELLMREAKEKNNFSDDIKLYDLLRLNSFLKQKKLNFPEELILPFNYKFSYNNSVENICKTYEELKNESSLLDFDDLLILTYYNISKNDNHFKKYSWIQVDEVQDLNPLQFEIINHISNYDAHEVFFGDYEQSIFSFMGAKLERLHALEKECKVHLLQKNFRSPSYLLNVYIDFAKEHLNPNWKKDPIPSEIKIKQENDLLLIETKGDDTREANIIVNNLLPKLIKKPDKQTAILVRTNDQADKFSRLLSQKNIEHFKVSGYDLFRRQVIKDIIAFLGCLENELDRVSWFRMMKIFGKVDTLKNSRNIINSIFSLGLLPTDFLKTESEYNNYLRGFYKYFLNERLVIFDTETTGLNTELDDIIQIAAIEIIKGKIGKSFEVFIKTEKSLENSIKIHKISNEFLSKNGLQPKEALKKFNDFIDGAVLVAHNLDFDLNILISNFNRNKVDSNIKSSVLKYDSIELTRRLFPRLSNYNLEYLIEEFNLEGENTHNALDDVKATADLVIHLVNNFIESKLNQQNEFINKNKSVLNKFSKNLRTLWQLYDNNSELETSFKEIIDKFINHSKDTVDYHIDDEEEKYLFKLLKHMEIKCGRKNFKQLIRHISDYKNYNEADLVLGDEKIIISTIHKAKGMEFENVIIPACVKDVYPNWNSKTDEEKEEDARTLYVALTRAKKRLIITTHSYFTSKYGNMYPREKSYFLKAIEKHFNKNL